MILLHALYGKGHIETLTSQTTQEFNLLSDLDNVVNLSDHTLLDAVPDLSVDSQMLVGAKVCDLIEGFLWFVCGLYVGILTSSLT